MQLDLFGKEAPEPKKQPTTTRRRWASKEEREYYKAIKAHVIHNLTHVPCLVDTTDLDPVDWAKTFLPLIASCQEQEDYEGAQATKDAIIEFLNGFGAEIPADFLLALPDYEDPKIKGIICLGVENDPSGMASDGAIIL